MKTRASVATLLARRHAAASSSLVIFSVNVVMNAVERAPSAKRSRNKFGARKAAMKASICALAPKSAAKTCSRTRPSKRLDITARLTRPADFVLILLTAAAGRGAALAAGASGAGIDSTGATVSAGSAGSLLMVGRSLAKTVHDGNAKSTLRHFFGDNHIDASLVESSQLRK